MQKNEQQPRSKKTLPSRSQSLRLETISETVQRPRVTILRSQSDARRRIEGRRVEYSDSRVSRLSRASKSSTEPNVQRLRSPFLSMDEALHRVGLFGNYQIFTCFIVQYASILWAGNFSFMSLGLGRLEPDWQCKDPGWNSTVYRAPTADRFIGNRSVCDILAGCSKLEAVNTEFLSLVADWRLICDDAGVPHTIFLVFHIGRIIGSLLGGHIGDHFGRKKGFFTAQFLLLVPSTLTVASTTWQAFTAVQLIVGLLYGVIEVTSLTLMLESTDSKYRLIPNAMFQWCLTYMVLALVAYITYNWRLYLIMVNLICAPTIVGYMLFQESPRWMVARGKLYKAAGGLTEIASERWNKHNVEIIHSDLDHIPRTQHHRFYWFPYLFSCRKLAVQSLLQLLSILTYSLIDSTYVYNMEAIPGSGPFMHMFWYGFIRLWVPFLVIWLDWKVPRFGRKALFLISLGISAVCFLFNIVLLACGYEKSNAAVVAFSVLASAVNASAFYMAIIQITCVAYPTVLRCIAFGTLNTMGDVGLILGVLVFRPLESVWSPLPYLIPEILAIITFVLAICFQPETKGRSLPDRYRDAK